MSRARRAALYLRVSTADKQTPENQEEPLRDYCAAQGFSVVKVYTDRESGARADRPALVQMLADAAAGRFDVLVFWALDRLSRQGIGKTLHLLETLKRAYRVDWVSYTQQFLNTTEPTGEIVLAVLAGFASLERQQIQARVKAGLARARAQGKRLGRPKRKPLTPSQRKQITARRAAGDSYRNIAAALNLQTTQVFEYIKTQENNPHVR